MAKKEKRSSSSSNIPPEIIEVILSKLSSSVKSLLRFKTVCKSWNTMISDPVFVQNHLKNSPNNLFLFNNFRSIINEGFSVFKLEGRKFHAEAVLERPYGCKVILCECNGVLLLSKCWQYCTKYVLCNPSTRREMHFECPYAYINEFPSVNRGICYDLITGDFKVVLIAKRAYAIYSCKNSSWTEKKLSTQYRGICSGIFVDGATYWVLVYNGKQELVYFDPRIDEIKRFQMPRKVSDGFGLFISSVGCLRGKLSLCTRNVDQTKIQIWIKEKGIGVGENIPNWKEFVTIDNVPTPFSFLKPICFVENKILCQLDKENFVYYSLSEKTFEEFETDDIYGYDHRQLIIYRSSLYFPTGLQM